MGAVSKRRRVPRDVSSIYDINMFRFTFLDPSLYLLWKSYVYFLLPQMSKDEAEAVARRMKDEEVLTGRVNPRAYKR